MDKPLLRKLKDHLIKCEEKLIDAGDAVVLDGEDPAKRFAEMHAAVRSARQHLDEAHGLLAEVRNNGGDDEDEDADKSFTPLYRKSKLDEPDRADVGAVRLQPVRELGGAFLAQDIQADAQRRLNEYWGWSR